MLVEAENEDVACKWIVALTEHANYATRFY